MLIGIDASRLIESGRTGTENYLYYLIRALSKIDTTNKYILYFKNDPTQNFITELTNLNSNFTYKVIKQPKFWTQLGLSRACFSDNLDILFTPWHTLPVIHPKKLRIVSTIHGLEYKWWQWYPTWCTVSLSDKIVAVSEFTKYDIIKKFKITAEKISVVYEGVDRELFYKRDTDEISYVKGKYNIKGDYVLFIGTLNNRKNIRRLLAAYSMLREENNNSAELVLAGGVGKEFQYLGRSAIDGVRVLGKVTQKDIYALISGALFVTLPSVKEGFGLPVLEAMACGVPVMSSNVSALPEVAGNAAYYVNPLSKSSISVGLKKLVEDVGLRAQLANLGTLQVAKFSWETTASKTVKVFEGVYNAG